MCRFILRLLVAVSIAHIPAMCCAQDPVKVTVCDLVTAPEKYSGKVIRVSSQVNLAFENFSLAQPGCEDAYPGVWLMYGGDAPTPTASTVNDLSRKPGSVMKVNGIPIPLVHDAALKLFRQRLGALRDTPIGNRPCYDCYFYRVTASLTGVFFAAKRDGQNFSGYGHLGCCHLLAIEKVSDVSAERTAIPMGGKFKCSTTKIVLSSDEALRLQALDKPCGTVDFKKCNDLQAQQMVQAALVFGDSIEPEDGEVTGTELAGDSTKYGWESSDKLRAYSLTINSVDPTNAQSKATSGVISKTACTALVSPPQR